MPRKIIAAVVLVVVLGIVGLSSVFTVSEQQQAIVLQFNAYVRDAKNAGLHFKIPFFQSVQYYDKRVLDYEVDLGEIPTSDQKQLLVDAFVRYRIDDPLKFYNTARSTQAFEARGSVQKGLLPAIVEAEVRAVFGRVDLATLLTPERAELMSEIARRVRTQADSWGVKMIDVRLKRLDLPRQNSNAVIERMETQRRQEAVKIRAEGDKESQRYTAEADKKVRIILAEADKKSQILRGEGEGKAQEIFNKAFGADPIFFEFWQCMQSVREGLADGTRYVGAPSGEILFQFCIAPKTMSGTTRN